MRQFLRHTILFGLLLSLLWMSTELLVPQTWVSHRHWETFRVYKHFLFPGSFYPDWSITRDSYGDMAHRDKEYRILKPKLRFQTDHLGFRNDHFVYEPDITFIGESNIVGSSVSQEHNLPNRVATHTGYSVYNIAPQHFNEFAKLLREGLIGKPKMLIYGCSERHIVKLKPFQLLPPKPNWFVQLRSNPYYLKTAVLIDRLYRSNTRHFIQARLNRNKNFGIPSPIDERMFFYQGKDAEIPSTQAYIQERAEIIEAYYTYTQELGIPFLFFPIPNKETVYYELVPFSQQPDFIAQLLLALEARNVPTLNILDLFNQKKQDTLLFHYDDSHWNEAGIELIAKALAPLAQQSVSVLD